MLYSDVCACQAISGIHYNLYIFFSIRISKPNGSGGEGREGQRGGERYREREYRKKKERGGGGVVIKEIDGERDEDYNRERMRKKTIKN